jgi:hypothetical protein
MQASITQCTRCLVAATIVVLSACGGGEDGDEGNALMRPGEDCLASGCHSASSKRPLTVAGTVFPDFGSSASSGLSGVSVVITDSNGAQTTLTTNAAGNFYTAKAMALPLESVYLVRDGRRTDMAAAPEGSCASCHKAKSSLGYVYAK